MLFRKEPWVFFFVDRSAHLHLELMFTSPQVFTKAIPNIYLSFLFKLCSVDSLVYYPTPAANPLFSCKTHRGKNGNTMSVCMTNGICCVYLVEIKMISLVEPTLRQHDQYQCETRSKWMKWAWRVSFGLVLWIWANRYLPGAILTQHDKVSVDIPV